jgi:hypothetical protein
LLPLLPPPQPFSTFGVGDFSHPGGWFLTVVLVVSFALRVDVTPLLLPFQFLSGESLGAVGFPYS